MINTTDTAPASPRLSIRVQGENPLHHLWNNNGTWWLYFHLKDAEGAAKRVRKSLKTKDLQQARSRRDRMLADLVKASGRILF